MARKFISWRRVSTERQNRSGLGLEAQKSIIEYFINYEKGEWIADYQECHTGTSLSTCTELKKAMEHCKREDAVLIIAKVDRFRTVVEALQILDYMGEKNIMFCDLPSSDRFSLTLYTALAEREALLVSIRTKQALAAKRARGELIAGAAPKWKETYNNKTENQRKKEAMEKGERKRANFQGSRDTKTFLEILKKEFPNLTKGNPEQWQWTLINCKRPHLGNILGRMQEYKGIDNKLFARWNFDLDCDQKLRCYMHTIKRSYGAVNC